MRIILGLCAAILAIGAVLVWRGTQLPTHYGSFTGAPRAAVADLIERPKEFLDKAVLVEGEVRQQCKTMGCYFFFISGEKMLRVDLEQIAMNAPMREGRPVRVEGQLVPFDHSYQLVASAVEFQ